MRLFRPFGKYFSETVNTPADMNAAETQVVGMLNGVDGGAWAPLNPINIGGAGVKMNAPISFNAPQSRVIWEHPYDFWAPTPATHTLEMADYQLGSQEPNGRLAAGGVMILPFRKLHNNALLSKIRVLWTVPSGLTSVPTFCPYALVYRQNPASSAPESLCSPGIVNFPNPSNPLDSPITDPVAYMNGGKPNIFTIIPDQNNRINKSLYHYGIELVLTQPPDLAGGGYFIHGVELTMTDINDLSAP